MPLYHLQALFVQYHSCYSLRKIGIYSGGKVKTIGGQFDLLESINKLTNLVHVTVEKAYVLMLSSTHNLPSVECAGEFHVDKAEGSLLGLRDLNILRGQLAIMSLDKIKCREEAYKGHLHLKKHVTKLELQWGSCKCASDTSWGFEVLDALKPHPDLEELTISGYPGARSPSWLDSGWLSRVQLICLRDCRRWEVLPPLGDLPLLKILEVRRMEELKTLGQELFGCAGFPNLETLLLERLPKLEWCHIDDNGVFSNLRHLSVSACPKLRVYPTYPRTLEHIAIMEKEDIQVKAFLRNSVEISRSFCCLVSSFFHVLHAHHLEFVEDMQIHVNENVVGMSRTVLGNLNSLKSLTIFGINRANTRSVLATLWDENGSTVLPSSLRRLCLKECYLEPSSFSKMLNSLSVLDTLSLEGCETVDNPCPPINIRMLKGLYIRRCYGITSFDVSEAFVPLEDMNIDRCPDLEYVPNLNDMPSLKKIFLRYCPQLLHLSNDGYQTTLKELTIESCDALPSLADLCGLVSLIKMRITRCSNFALLPNMDSFYSLRVLMIEHCPQLTSLPRSGLPVSLEAFVLHGCHPALNEQFQLKEGPDWDKVAALPGCIYSEQRGSSIWGKF
ncbi:hypothetical protein QOZ80_6BG0498660 [Eleusine coracana subsp. coracana]|nr:hypothetical protein QOZ80_6BG0498660 [Eleusine coracana subsp. coracana]